MKNWIIRKLGGYTKMDLEQYIFNREAEVLEGRISGTALELSKIINK